jgi:type II restriction/modification system DNA methylase subunit YeeA
MAEINTNHLKRFAQEARTKLIEQVGSKMEYVLTSDSSELREKASQVRKLQEAINTSSKEQVIDRVAYTWFNRLMALRFMDANEYQPIGIRVVTPKEGYTLPELLDEAKQGNIPDELPINQQHIYDVLDGKIPSNNPQNEAYKELLIGACNHLNKVFPFLFEKLSDYTELLLPDDLISEFSIVQDVRDGMTVEDCQDVEIIGWLYQFYISERKDELINAKKRYKADEIAPVTQLFTPKWIVQYMVDNTLGQLWKEARPNTTITNGLEFYIKPNNPELIPSRDLKSLEDITFFDPCVGSAHVLCYAYDIFYKMYEEEGYNPSDIPELILTKNLFGIDIDDRAAQLASFALMMKGRKNQRRFFRKNIIPNITAFQNIESHPKFENAKVLGSLIKITKDDVEDITVDETSLFVERDIQLKKQASLLAAKYDIVVTNPPYLNSGYMEETLKQFVNKEYKSTKSDLFACFFLQSCYFTKLDGLVGLISPFVWMFISSYEKLRNELLKNSTLASLIQLEYNAFGPAMVPVCTFVLRNQFIDDYMGSYVKLSDFTGSENQAPRTLEAIQNPDCGWFYNANQKDFEKLPGNPIGYSLSENMLNAYNNKLLSEFAIPRAGMITGNNSIFLRFFHEVNLSKIGFSFSCRKDAKESKSKWFPYQKGGPFRKWYGNLEYIVDFENDGLKLRTLTNSQGKVPAHAFNDDYIFKTNVNWSSLTAGKFSTRITENGNLFDASGSAAFPLSYEESCYLSAFLNSNITQKLLSVINPTLNFQAWEIGGLPINSRVLNEDGLLNMIIICRETSLVEWNSHETSWDFTQNELIRIKAQDLEETYDLFQQYWKNKFFQLHKNEEELNRQFIDIYGLQDELTPEVPLKDITILKEETDIVNNELVFDAQEVFAQFMSYAVGCMFGRYSLDKDGLILANQGETLEDYLNKVEKSEDVVSFLPDDDNIIPILDDEWFEDDIVGRFYEFLKVTFGNANFEKNLAFVEECLGKDVRKYFVRDFYKDHIKRYKKRPIYWLFSSPKGAFNVLIYMHRYTPDTLNLILNEYLIEYREKLNTRTEHLDHLIETGSSSEQTKASKEKDKLKLVLLELQEYEREVLYPLATERIAIDLDDGVLVNYNKFGEAIKKVAGLNDKKAKDKVKGFDWIDTADII